MANKYNLVGVDGNAFAVMGYVQEALRKERLGDRIDEYIVAATSGDYYNLLVQSSKYIDIANKAAKASR